MREKHGLQFIHNSKGSDYIAGVVAATKGLTIDQKEIVEKLLRYLGRKPRSEA